VKYKNGTLKHSRNFDPELDSDQQVWGGTFLGFRIFLEAGPMCRQGVTAACRACHPKKLVLLFRWGDVSSHLAFRLLAVVITY